MSAKLQTGSRSGLTGFARRLTVGQSFALACGMLVLVAIAGIVAGELALHRLSSARALTLEEIDPARVTSLEVSTALIDEETGVRGYVISGGQLTFLSPYTNGLRREREGYAKLARLTRHQSLNDVRNDLLAVQRAAQRWRSEYALETIANRRAGPTSTTTVRADAGKALFDALRHALSRLNKALQAAGAHARTQLNHAEKLVEVVFAIFAALLLLGASALAYALRVGISRPLARLAVQIHHVARGSFESPIEGEGPRDVLELASNVDSMRERIVHELEALRKANEILDAQTHELERSNSEHEQFAYVASHDLQEPLRKVASFTQLLQHRYEGQLDERADQYIGFAVDGATRMQRLINDLLVFSRVGRVGDKQEVVDLNDSLRQALVSLATLIDESKASINAHDLPSVRGEPGLLSLVFQNLVGNALKFKGEREPVVDIHARREGPEWLISCSDNGIGVDPQYAERIFVIFQRLHSKEQYAGTGIGLAMCRKIIEYHGGRIWLDQTVGEGTTFNFTLPAI